MSKRKGNGNGSAGPVCLPGVTCTDEAGLQHPVWVPSAEQIASAIRSDKTALGIESVEVVDGLVMLGIRPPTQPKHVRITGSDHAKIVSVRSPGFFSLDAAKGLCLKVQFEAYCENVGKAIPRMSKTKGAGATATGEPSTFAGIGGA